MNKTEMCVAAYQKHKHLKLAGEEIGVPWQTVYVHLRLAGIPVVGDKSRYGSASDRLAALSEAEFVKLVPAARNQNKTLFQSKIDFFVHGYGVDVKASRPKRQSRKAKTRRWAFSLKKQELVADFFVCFAYGDDGEIEHAFLIPGEIVRHYSTLSIAATKIGKWWAYKIEPGALNEFFDSLPRRL